MKFNNSKKTSLESFNRELNCFISRIYEDVKKAFTPTKSYEEWLKSENLPDTNKFCMETAYTLVNEVILLHICKQKGVLNTVDVDGYDDIHLMKTGIKSIYPYIFENEVFDWYKPNSSLMKDMLIFINNTYAENPGSDILGKLYELVIPNTERKNHGQFYTPEYIVDFILNDVGYTKKCEGMKLLDPSCGSGAFTTKAMSRLISSSDIKNYNEQFLNSAISSVYGIDINPFACYLAETNILIQLLDVIKVVKTKNPKYTLPKINIFRANTIAKGSLFDEEPAVIKQLKNKEGIFSRGFDFVVGNPPYLEAKKMGSELKEQCRISCPASTKGAFDLFICFIDIGLRLLKENGKLGYIIPNKFLIANYAKNLRSYVLDQYSIKRIVDVSECDVFQSVSVYPIIITIENNFPKDNCVLTSGGLIKPKDLIRNKFPSSSIKQTCYNRDDKVFFTLPDDKTGSDLLKRLLESDFQTLDKLVEIKWTISFHSTGLREKFIFDRKPNSQYAKRLIGGGSFKGNGDIRRYRLNWGGWWINYDENLAKKYENQLPPREIFERSKLIICQNAKRLLATYDEEGFFCKDTFFVCFEKENISVSILYVLALLNSKLLHYYYANIYKGTHVAGGYLHYLVGYLNSLPIAQPTQKQEKYLIELVKILLKCKDAEFNRIDREIDKSIYEIYHLKENEIDLVENFIDETSKTSL